MLAYARAIPRVKNIVHSYASKSFSISLTFSLLTCIGIAGRICGSSLISSRIDTTSSLVPESFM